MSREAVDISIVIPTRERVETLWATLKTALAQASQRIEVLVADNSSADGTANLMASVGDPRVRYINPGQRLSMSANWDFALAQARGTYILIIGDDDGIVPGAIDRLLVDVERNPTDVYMWPKQVYVWPSGNRGAYVESTEPPGDPHWVDLGRISTTVLRFGGWGHYGLPSMYHSLVARRIPDDIRRKHGRVYHAAQPDVFMGMCIPAFTKVAWNVGYSVTVHGRSPKSNGWVGTENRPPVEIERFIAEYGDYRVHPTLYPEIPIIANLTPDSLLVARDLFVDHYREVAFGYEAMWAFICREAPVFKWNITPWEVVRSRERIRRYHRLSLSRFAAYLAWQVGRASLSRTRRRGRRSSTADDIASFVHEVRPA